MTVSDTAGTRLKHTLQDKFSGIKDEEQESDSKAKQVERGIGDKHCLSTGMLHSENSTKGIQMMLTVIVIILQYVQALPRCPGHIAGVKK